MFLRVLRRACRLWYVRVHCSLHTSLQISQLVATRRNSPQTRCPLMTSHPVFSPLPSEWTGLGRSSDTGHTAQRGLVLCRRVSSDTCCWIIGVNALHNFSDPTSRSRSVRVTQWSCSVSRKNARIRTNWVFVVLMEKQKCSISVTQHLTKLLCDWNVLGEVTKCTEMLF